MMLRKSILGWIIIAAISFSACASDKDNKTTKTAASQASSASMNSETNPADKAKVERTTFKVDAIDASALEIEAALNTANNGNTAAAISSLNQITSSNPKAFLGYYNLGILHERQLDSMNARNAYESALRAEPGFSPALIQLVRLLVRAGNTSSALSIANQYINANPNVFEHNYAKLEAMIAGKQYDEAILLARSLLKRDEANPKLRYYIASAEFEKNRYRLAEFMVAESLEIDPDDDEALFLRAKIHDALSEEDVSLIPGIASTLDRVLEINPDHLEALWMRGVIYYEASNYTKAEEFFRHVIELNPSIADAYVDLANTLKTVDRGPEAEQLLNKARQLEPNNGLVDFAFGTLYLNIELIKLPGMNDMDRLKLAKTQFESAKSHWTSKDDIELAKGYIRTTEDAIETLQTLLDAQALFGPAPSDDSSGDDANSKQDTGSKKTNYLVD